MVSFSPPKSLSEYWGIGVYFAQREARLILANQQHFEQQLRFANRSPIQSTNKAQACLSSPIRRRRVQSGMTAGCQQKQAVFSTDGSPGEPSWTHPSRLIRQGRNKKKQSVTYNSHAEVHCAGWAVAKQLVGTAVYAWKPIWKAIKQISLN